MCFCSYSCSLPRSVAQDLGIYVIAPTCRSTAEALHTMFSHTLEHVAPFLVGVLADGLKPGIQSTNPGYCPDLVDFYAIQYAMFLPFGVLCVGGVLFLLVCRWVEVDNQTVETLE